MLIKRKKSWELSENAVTDQALYKNRRRFIKGAGAIAGGALLAACRPARPETLYDPRVEAEPTARPPAPTSQAVEAATSAPETSSDAVVEDVVEPTKSLLRPKPTTTFLAMS